MILNVLFEIKIHQDADKNVLIIIDDIADSFDYKNKYAIVEYLKDIADTPHFSLLLLTHNFDFHRIVSSRIIDSRSKKLMATKTANSVQLDEEKYQKDVFAAWKQEWHSNEAYALASIPFARNIADYCGRKDHNEKLTSLLHIKSNSKSTTIGELQDIYRSIFTDKDTVVLPNGTLKVIDQIYSLASAFSDGATETLELENKILVAMAVRLKAEEFMIARINDPEFVACIKKDQTRKLFDRFKTDFSSETKSLEILDQVNLMTPENIHLNSFMYEPILDMSASKLYRLYADVKAL